MEGKYWYDEHCCRDSVSIKKEDFRQSFLKGLEKTKTLFSDFSDNYDQPESCEGYRGLIGYVYPSIDIEINFYARENGAPDIEYFICRQFVKKSENNGEPFFESDANVESYLSPEDVYDIDGAKGCRPLNVNFEDDNWEEQMKAEMKRVLDLIIEKKEFDPMSPELIPEIKTA